MAHKVKALQQWCKLRCDGYRDVEVTNMTSSWKSGLAFCAIIHRYRPDLIDYDSLKKEDTYGNSKKAFDVALYELGIAALLDPEDMVAMTVPDKLCIVTYVAQYYNYFHDKPQLGGPGVKSAVKRSLRATYMSNLPEPKEATAKNATTTTRVVPVEKEVSPAAKRRTIEDRCCMCHEKVYLLERYYNGGKLYHRHCYRESERSSTVRSGKFQEAPNEKAESLLKENRAPKILDATVSNQSPSDHKTSTNLLKSILVPKAYKSEGSEISRDLAKNSAFPASNVHVTSQSNNPVTAGSFLHSKSDLPKKDTVVTSVTPSKYSTKVENSPKSFGVSYGLTNKQSHSNPAASSFPVVSSSVNTSKYTSNLVTNTSGLTTATTTTTATIVTSVSGLPSSSHLEVKNIEASGGAPVSVSSSGDVTFTVKYSGDNVNKPTPTSFAKGNVSNNRGGSPLFSSDQKKTEVKYSSDQKKMEVKPFSDQKKMEVKPFSDQKKMEVKPFSDQKKVEVKANGMKDSNAGKTEWQLEAERRQAARNGVYVDPEKQPRTATKENTENRLGDRSGDQLLKEYKPESKTPDGLKDSVSKTDDSKKQAKETLAVILKKQLNPVKESGGIRVTGDACSPRLPVEDSKLPEKSPLVKDSDWVMVEHPSAPDRTAEHNLSFEETPVLSPPERFKQIVREGSFGFSGNDRMSAISPPSSCPPSHPIMPKKIGNPLVPKRKVNAEEKISVDKINKKLSSLDERLRVVETKGRELEDKIRTGTEEAMDEDEEELMIHWFNLVKQKYELVREESDLMYRRRQQELEELHEELEYQYRCLTISKPDEEKTVEEKKYEEDLLNEILEIVKQRDSIIDSIEVDRQRYLEEDEKIVNMMEVAGVSPSGKEKKRKKNKKKTALAEKKGVQKKSSFWNKAPKLPKE